MCVGASLCQLLVDLVALLSMSAMVLLLFVPQAVLFGSEAVQELGWWYCIAPCMTSTVALVATAGVINNLFLSRQYPKQWW